MYAYIYIYIYFIIILLLFWVYHSIMVYQAQFFSPTEHKQSACFNFAHLSLMEWKQRNIWPTVSLLTETWYRDQRLCAADCIGNGSEKQTENSQLSVC